MRTSDTIAKLAAGLLAAQRNIKFATKDAKNPHFKNTYADLPAVIDAIKPALNDAGIVFMQSPSPSEAGTLALTTRLIHESGEWLEDTAIVPLPKNDPQGYGSAMTYARRYSLAAVTGLYQDDDDGMAASHAPAKAAPAKAPPPPQFMTAEQIAIIENAAKAAGKDIAKICKRAEVASLAEMPSDWFEAVLNGISAPKTKEAA